MASKMRRIIIDSMVSVSIAIILLFVAEFGLRIFHPEMIQELEKERRRVENLAYRFHPEYLIALKPNVRKDFPRAQVDGGDVVHWATNSASFRGPELTVQPELRVMVYGDSNIQARFSHIENTFSYKLQEYLASSSSRDIEVVNAGIAGSGPDQVLIRFSLDVDTYKPDIIVFHIFADNDFGDIVRNRLFDMNAEGALVRTKFEPTMDQQLRSTASRFLVTKAAKKMLKIVSGNYADFVDPDTLSAEQTASNMLALADLEYAVYKEGRPRFFSHFADHYDLDIALHPNGESSATKIALLEGVLRKVTAIADDKNVEVVVLIQPSSADLTRSLSLNYGDLQRYPDYRRDRLTSIIDGICAAYEIHRVNLYPIFYNNSPQTLYFKAKDDHWNDAGQELAARETANYIRNNIQIK